MDNPTPALEVVEANRDFMEMEPGISVQVIDPRGTPLHRLDQT